jgi:hypothetical protein
MKPVFSTESELEFQAAWNRLTDAGIPVTEPPKHSELSGYKVGPHMRTICVWLDSQFEDACKLLSDPGHTVRNPVSWEEFQKIQQQVDEQHSESLSSFNERALNWLVGAGAVGLAIFGAYHVFK